MSNAFEDGRKAYEAAGKKAGNVNDEIRLLREINAELYAALQAMLACIEIAGDSYGNMGAARAALAKARAEK